MTTGCEWINPRRQWCDRAWTKDESVLIVWYKHNRKNKTLPLKPFRITGYAEITDWKRFYAWLDGATGTPVAKSHQAISGMVKTWLVALKEYCDAKAQKGRLQDKPVPQRAAKKVQRVPLFS